MLAVPPVELTICAVYHKGLFFARGRNKIPVVFCKRWKGCLFHGLRFAAQIKGSPVRETVCTHGVKGLIGNGAYGLGAV